MVEHEAAGNVGAESLVGGRQYIQSFAISSSRLRWILFCDRRRLYFPDDRLPLSGSDRSVKSRQSIHPASHHHEATQRRSSSRFPRQRPVVIGSCRARTRSHGEGAGGILRVVCSCVCGRGKTDALEIARSATEDPTEFSPRVARNTSSALSVQYAILKYPAASASFRTKTRVFKFPFLFGASLAPRFGTCSSLPFEDYAPVFESRSVVTRVSAARNHRWAVSLTRPISDRASLADRGHRAFVV